jgi:hypothetical protein
VQIPDYTTQLEAMVRRAAQARATYITSLLHQWAARTGYPLESAEVVLDKTLTGERFRVRLHGQDGADDVQGQWAMHIYTTQGPK